MSKVVKNQSQGHGYRYTSLADFANNGIEIPKMRITNDEHGEFIEYKDGDEWHKGAKIVDPGENKRMNAAQAYGAALTYARRYTVALATATVTGDDDAVETEEWSKPEPTNDGWKAEPATPQQRAALRGIFSDKYDAVIEKVGGAEKLTKAKASELIAAGKAKKEQQEGDA